MKTLHGKRHIRARKSVAIGREKKQIHKINRLSDNLGIISKASMETATYTEGLAKAWSVLLSRFYQGVILNSDGTRTHTWNFKTKG